MGGVVRMCVCVCIYTGLKSTRIIIIIIIIMLHGVYKDIKY